jgi:hypothetical protein
MHARPTRKQSSGRKQAVDSLASYGRCLNRLTSMQARKLCAWDWRSGRRLVTSMRRPGLASKSVATSGAAPTPSGERPLPPASAHGESGMQFSHIYGHCVLLWHTPE